MAIKFSKTGISNGNVINPGHITQFVDAFTAASASEIFISGTLIVTGSVIADAFVGSLTASSADSSSVAISSSHALIADSLNGSVTSASYSPVEPAFSESYSTRITTNETNIINLQTDSGSFSTRITTIEQDTTASFAETSSWANNVISSSYSETASYALNAGGGSSQWTGSGDYISRESDVQITGSLNIRTTTPTRIVLPNEIPNNFVLYSEAITENIIHTDTDAGQLRLCETNQIPVLIGTSNSNISNGLHVWSNVSASSFFGDGTNLSLSPGQSSFWTGSYDSSGSIKRISDIEVTGSVNVSNNITTNNLYATNKYFSIKHPLYADKKLIHASVETNAHEVYYRGTIIWRKFQKKHVLKLPEYFWKLVDNNFVDVYLTSRNIFNDYYYEIKDKKIIIFRKKIRKIHKTSWLVFGERLDVSKLTEIQ